MALIVSIRHLLLINNAYSVILIIDKGGRRGILNIFLKISIVILFGVIGAKIARRLNLPNVTGYIVMGLLLGPSFLNLVTPEATPIISFVNEFALGIIAFAIEDILGDMSKPGVGLMFVMPVDRVVGWTK